VEPANGGTERRRKREVEALVQAARQGDARAFESLVRRYRPRIFALALHMTGRPSDADDVTQEVFIRAFCKIREFEGRSAFFTWLYRIALNLSLNLRRDARRRRAVGLDDVRVRMAAAVDSHGDPRLVLELRETYALLVRALDRLSPCLRATVVLVALQGFSYREAARVLGTTEGNIGWRIHHARAKLRRSIRSMTREPTPLPRPKTDRTAERWSGLIRILRLDSLFPDAAPG
jgi:RNA polymerase sigma-70 factor (ECF subfamily)